AQTPQDLDTLDRIDPQVGLEVKVELEHLGRISGPITDDRQQARGQRVATWALALDRRRDGGWSCDGRNRGRGSLKLRRGCGLGAAIGLSIDVGVAILDIGRLDLNASARRLRLAY